MKARPEFTVIAGPNGAGKSRLCPYYIHCKSFDGDLLALNLRKEHPEWEERWIGGTVASTLQKQKDEAIASQKDFAFDRKVEYTTHIDIYRQGHLLNQVSFFRLWTVLEKILIGLRTFHIFSIYLQRFPIAVVIGIAFIEKRCY